MYRKNKIVISFLLVIICVMVLGYALLAQELTINGSASIDSEWDIEITAVDEIFNNGSGRTVSKNYTATTANFNTELIHTGDNITYRIEVTNKGTLDAVLESIVVSTDDNPAIKYTTSGLKRGDKIAKNNGKQYLNVKVEYDRDVTNQPVNVTSNITVTLNYQHDLGQLYESYAIGDSISFGDSNWYVIKNSSVDEDYVTVIKDRVLTREELGEYAESNSNTMKYKDIYDTSTSGNYASITYDKSNVKKFLEESYLSSLESSSNNEYSNETGATNLKEVDGYKIRLIKFEELTGELGYEYDSRATTYVTKFENANVWLYGSSFGSYWTMSFNLSSSTFAWYVSQYGSLRSEGRNLAMSIRPVINLYKNSIE